MEEKSYRALKITVFIIALLLFAVVLFAFFTFTENNSVDKNHRFNQIIAANLSVENSNSSGRYSFSVRTDKPGSSSDTDSSSEEKSNSSKNSKSSFNSSSKSVSQSDSVIEASHSESQSSTRIVEKTGIVPIMGKNVLTKQQLFNYSESHVSKMRLTCTVEELIDYYLSIGEEYGIRGDIAYLQAVNETGWFQFKRPNSYKKKVNGETVTVYEPRPEGLYVVPEDNNFCGLGVTGYAGDEGKLCRFATAKLGVTAHIQHLYAYATKAALPSGKTQVDPRFKYVTRGCAPNWCDLTNKWAMTIGYGEGITATYYAVLEKY